ncbi:MAG: chromate transporter, partial [Porticoccaceae bacterium]|nr:chromate transporter [Porticoccaceae bacterium]
MKLHWQLFVAFFRIGIFGFGGGPSMIPLFKAEVVTRYGWMSDDEFGDVLAIGNTLPGPIATKMSGYIGYRMGGIAGCLNALIALVIPSVLLMVVFLVLLTQYKDQAW